MSKLWITNDPVIAARLKAADRRYVQARKVARGMVLSDKIEHLRTAKRDWEREYSVIMSERREPLGRSGL